MSTTVTSLHRFPVKSCRGESVPELLIEPWGPAGDRRWMLVDAAGEVITAREVNRLVLIDPSITPDGLVVTAPDLPPLTVPVPDPAAQTPVSLWSSHLTAATAIPAADAWFSAAMGRAARLVYLDDPTRRPTSFEFSEPDDRVSFADGYPLLLATEESLTALNDAVVEASQGAHDPLPMTRFRPNIVVSGAPAWAEDDWRRLRVGGATFRAVSGCARCVITTIDPETGLREKEPVATLARLRRWDGKTWFAINLVPDTADVTIRVGDEVEVLEAAEPGDGPVRSGR